MLTTVKIKGVPLVPYRQRHHLGGLVPQGVPRPKSKLILTRIFTKGETSAAFRDDETSLFTSHDIGVRKQSVLVKGLDGIPGTRKTAFATREQKLAFSPFLRQQVFAFIGASVPFFRRTGKDYLRRGAKCGAPLFFQHDDLIVNAAYLGLCGVYRVHSGARYVVANDEEFMIDPPFSERL